MTNATTLQHTPGPWHVENKGGMPGEKWIMANRWTRIARADGGSAANFIANARLLAAGPELLATLREIANHTCDATCAADGCESRGRARAAIEKATQ